MKTYKDFVKYCIETRAFPNGMTGNQATFAAWLLDSEEKQKALSQIGNLERVFKIVQHFLKDGK